MITILKVWGLHKSPKLSLARKLNLLRQLICRKMSVVTPLQSTHIPPHNNVLFVVNIMGHSVITVVDLIFFGGALIPYDNELIINSISPVLLSFYV